MVEDFKRKPLVFIGEVALNVAVKSTVTTCTWTMYSPSNDDGLKKKKKYKKN